MIFFPVLAIAFVMQIVGIVFLLCSVALILVILIQKGRGGGLSGAFAGGMASGLLGSKIGDTLTWITIGMATVFLLLALTMGRWYKPAIQERIDPSMTPATQTQPAEGAPADANVTLTPEQPAPEAEPTGLGTEPMIDTTPSEANTSGG